MVKHLVFVGSALLLAAACSQNERNNYRKEPLSAVDSAAEKVVADSGKLVDRDSEFVTAVAISGMVEIKAGELAKKRSTDTAIQNFGALLIKQHQQLAKDLKATLSLRHFTLPEQLDTNQQQRLNELATKSSQVFDQAFLQWMIEDHQKMVDWFSLQGSHAKDVQIQSFANKNLPILKNHLLIAKELRKQK
ncbi:DUF4142 domain-containing protein [Olivibacter ginsenosidimutans]